jgi:hypothetical protein
LRRPHFVAVLVSFWCSVAHNWLKLQSLALLVGREHVSYCD